MLNDTAKNSMLDHLATEAVYVALTDDTDTELTGGDPAYERQPITWNEAAAGEMTASNTPVFDVPSGATVGKVKFYDDLTGGTLYGEYDVTNETYGGQGTYTVTSAQIDLNAV